MLRRCLQPQLEPIHLTSDSSGAPHAPQRRRCCWGTAYPL